MTVSPLFRTLLVSMLFAACSDESDGAAIGVAKLSSSQCTEASTAGDNRCVISQREGKTLALQVFGLRALCLEGELLAELPWHGVAREDGPGRVIVSVDWPSDKTPACGSCAYDFKVELGPYNWQDTTDIKFEVRSCPSCNVDDSRSVTLSTKADERSSHACGDEQLDAGA